MQMRSLTLDHRLMLQHSWQDYVILRKSSKANQIPGRQKLEKFHQLQQQIPTKEKSTLNQNISISVRGLNNPKGTRIAGKIQERCQLIS